MAVFVNEVGYIVGKSKHANVVGAKKVSLYNAQNELVKEYDIANYEFEKLSGEDTSLVDFSELDTEGTYYFKDDSGAESCHFVISSNPYKELSKATLKMFYYQRCGCELEEKYAGIYKHKICHTGKVKHIHNSDISFDCTGGWHDAGDFGRYTTAGAVAVAHLLYAFILNPDAFKETINIPESGNGTPDILNECRYELEWLLKMQAADGGVYHKCTSMWHAPFSMPEDDNLPFIVTEVSSLAVADFAAVCALASRVYAPYDSEFSEKLKAAALKSDKWLDNNQKLLFDEDPNCTTGGYGDLCDIDERLWAEAELYRIDGDSKHLSKINIYLDMNLNFTSLGWMDVGGFAALCVLTGEKIFTDVQYDHFKCAMLDEADRLKNTTLKNMYEVAMHSYNFKWGSNMVLLTGAMILCIANTLTDNKTYTDAIIYQLDYLLGRNPLDLSYVTGFGDHAFMNPHNRPTASDGIEAPIPGFVSGGPNQDHCDEDSLANIKLNTAPMKCYVDIVGSYSTNEITIYWNSPLVYILAYIAKIV